MQFSTIFLAALAATTAIAVPVDERAVQDVLIDWYSPSTGCTPFNAPSLRNQTYPRGCTNITSPINKSAIIKILGRGCTLELWSTPNCTEQPGQTGRITVTRADPTPNGCKANGGSGTESLNLICV